MISRITLRPGHTYFGPRSRPWETSSHRRHHGAGHQAVPTPERTMSPVRQIKRALVGEAAIRAAIRDRHGGGMISRITLRPGHTYFGPRSRPWETSSHRRHHGAGHQAVPTPERTMSPVRQIKRALVGEAAIREPSPGARRKCRHDRIETSESVPPERNLVPPGRRRDDLENYVEAGPHLFRTSQPTLGDIQPPTPSWGGPPSGPDPGENHEEAAIRERGFAWSNLGGRPHQDPGENHEPGETNKTSPCRRGRN